MSKTYEAMAKNEKTTATGQRPSVAISGLRFPNLQNRKQINDLEKKIVSYIEKKDFKIFNFASTRGAEGVSTVIVNLIRQVSLKKKSRRILLIDANFKNPALDAAFQISDAGGLSDVLLGNAACSDVVRKIESNAVHLLPAGTDCINSVDNIEQRKLVDVLAELKNNYDYVIIDSPPILTSSDSLTTAVASDVTFFVIKSMKIQKEAAEKAKHLLQENDCLIGGVILNCVRQVIPEWLYGVL